MAMGKKKKKKNVQKDPAVILKKGETFFQKGNYLLAKREFEKLGDLTGQEDLLKRVERCDREIQQQKARELLKKARKIEKSANPASVLKCFEEAYAILGEDWIRKKIEQLRSKTLEIDGSRAAKDAEAAGDYLKAAALYGCASEARENQEMLLRKAVCLVKGEAYGEAVSAFKDLALEEQRHGYDFGFALAKTGKYAECLKVWDRISSGDEGFLEQKSQVAALLVSDLHAAFQNQEDPERIYKEGTYLLDAGYAGSGISTVVEQSMFVRIGKMWENEAYEGILELLQQSSLQLKPALIRLYAGVWFKLIEKSGKWNEDFPMFWISAVYSEDFESGLSDAGQCHGVRKLLMAWAEDLLNDSAKTDGAVAEWSLEKDGAATIHTLKQALKTAGLSVLTPRLAGKTGESSDLLGLVRENRGLCKSREDYLRTGCCYSPAWKSFYHLARGEYEKAVETLSAGEKGDEFTEYVEGSVFFAYGQWCILRGKRPPNEYLSRMLAFFDTAPEYEKQFIEAALDAVDLNVLQRFEEVLMGIHDGRPSDESANALSLVMSRRAIKMATRKLMTEKVFSMSLKKALEINPENEHARGLLKDAQSNLDMMALGKALKQNKMNMACKIARESQSDLVRKEFFDYFERHLEDMDSELTSKSEKIFYLEDFYKWCARVDDDHDILWDIEEKIDELEEENYS